MKNVYFVLSIVFCVGGLVCFLTGGVGTIALLTHSAPNASVGFRGICEMAYGGVIAFGVGVFFGVTSESL